MGTGAEIALVAAAVAGAGASVMGAAANKKAAAQAAALARQQQEERKAIIQADMLDKENEILRQNSRNQASIRNRRPYNSAANALATGTTSLRAGLDEETRLTNASIRTLKIQGLSSIRQGQFQVAQADIKASAASSAFKLSFIKAAASITGAAAKAGAFDGPGGGGPAMDNSGVMDDFEAGTGL